MGRVTPLRFKLVNFANSFNGINKMSPLGGIHSSDAFRTILERERARAERTGQIFSLVVFSIDKDVGTDATSLEQLGYVLGQKVRICDEVGWYDGNCIGTILPGTSAEGARQFIDIIKERIKDVAPHLNCSIYSYPSPWIKSDVHEKGSEEAQAPFDTGKSVERIEILFARPIPIWKRLLDFFGALFLLILISPLFTLVAFFIKIVSPGPIFYRQERIGYQGRRFTLWKFRTMHVNNNAAGHEQYLTYLIESDAPMMKLDDKRDHRIIPFGNVLRSSCIDELPQLINVLLGDMSLVGPRPCLPYEAEKYLQWHTRRFDTVPGMTGLWQVSGKNRLTFKQMIRLDIRYARKMSLWLDAKILFLTGPAILWMVSKPLVQKARIGHETVVFTPSRKEETVRG
jgi:lipopolysaccharide/colanic/teichoic acid biosynthesis glycosyltransferase